jgi:hypothetical protein
MSSLALARTIPVSPPMVKRMMKPSLHSIGVDIFLLVIPCMVKIQLKTLIPVGIPIITVAAVK